MHTRVQCCHQKCASLQFPKRSLYGKGCGPVRSKATSSRKWCVRTPVKAQLLPVALASAQMRNPHYSITVAEVLDSPLGYLALMAVPIGLYFMFKILLWDYTSRRTDDPSDPDRSQSFSLSSRPGPGQMPQQDLPAPVRHLVKDPALQAMAAEAASKVADAVRQAKAEYEGELKLRSLNNDYVGAKEWDWVWSMLQGKEGSITATANPDLLAKAQEQVKKGEPANSGAAVSTMLAEVVAEQQALQQVENLCTTLAKN
ncbi:TPA: hypothetical protein ACH3X3_006472 [Trebouxia sp. C0006]